MPKFIIAFIPPVKYPQPIISVVSSESSKTALKEFFEKEAAEFYTNDSEGFQYFTDDFFETTFPSGNMIRLDR